MGSSLKFGKITIYFIVFLLEYVMLSIK